MSSQLGCSWLNWQVYYEYQTEISSSCINSLFFLSWTKIKIICIRAAPNLTSQAFLLAWLLVKRPAKLKLLDDYHLLWLMRLKDYQNIGSFCEISINSVYDYFLGVEGLLDSRSRVVQKRHQCIVARQNFAKYCVSRRIG